MTFLRLILGQRWDSIIRGPCFVMNEHPIARMELSIGRIETIAYYLSCPNVSGSLYMIFTWFLRVFYMVLHDFYKMFMDFHEIL